MPDMLVKLYEIKDDWSFLAEQEKWGIIIRKPIGPEKHLVIDWVREKFSDGWASEIDNIEGRFPYFLNTDQSLESECKTPLLTADEQPPLV
jgi:hypothetical protein